MNLNELVYSAAEDLKHGRENEAKFKMMKAKNMQIEFEFSEISNEIYNSLKEDDEQFAEKFKQLYFNCMDENNVLYNNQQYDSEQKNIATAILLCMFLGTFGAHRFYDKRTATAVVMLLMCLCFIFIPIISIIPPIWAFVDLLIYISKVREYNIEV